MKEGIVYYGYVDITDDIFTKERLTGLQQQILNAYKVVMSDMMEKIDRDTPVRFFLNEALLDEVVVDAVIGMRKITDSQYNSVKNPNAFKVVSYMTYWWLRHKPVSIHYPSGFSLETDLHIRDNGRSNEEAREYERNKTIWQLKHLNEMVAVEFAFTYIFDLNTPVYTNKECKMVKRKEGDKFAFADYDEMLKVFLEKLLYYFSYRTITPKVIEQILEAYTFHPAWSLTGKHWAVEES